jgi:hypothetical protein
MEISLKSNARIRLSPIGFQIVKFPIAMDLIGTQHFTFGRKKVSVAFSLKRPIGDDPS